MPTVRIDDEVYAWLKSQAEPFEDNPNSVLRRVADLEDKDHRVGGSSSRMGEKLSGRKLSRRWGVDVRHALYHREGTFYENIRRFPGALFDYHGYVVFQTEQDYQKSTYLLKGQKLNVPSGISSIPGYIGVR